MTGTLYGIGVGPGDPELMTIKAVKKIRECQVLALPAKTREGCTAYKIAVQAVPEMAQKECICLDFPMVKDETHLKESHEKAADTVMEILSRGHDVAFITLGDSSIYSTYLYIHEKVVERGFQACMINGIPSFCAVAARLNIPLVNGAQELHVIPASYQVEEALKMPGVKVLMKAGRKMGEVKQLLIASDCQVAMVENCGMEGEKIYLSPQEIPEDAGYFSLMIVS